MDGLAARYGLEEQFHELKTGQRDFYDLDDESMVILSKEELDKYGVFN